MARVEEDPLMTVPGEVASGAVASEAALEPEGASAAAGMEVPPELLAQSLGQYLRGWWLRGRSGDSGVLPVILGLVVVGEIDLSIGAVALLGGVIAFKMVQSPGPGLPWWLAIAVALLCCGAIGARQGTLMARLRIPSFVVTLAGFLLFSGILCPVVGWTLLAVVVLATGAVLWLRASAK